MAPNRCEHLHYLDTVFEMLSPKEPEVLGKIAD